MNVKFLSIEDVKNSEYLREDNKNLLLTPTGISDTIALCGVLKNIINTKYGPNISIDDGTGDMSITAGTFNKKLQRSIEKITEKFEKKKEEIYLLIYANPYETDRLYLNANNDNSVLEVDKKNFIEFHKMRKSASEHLSGKIEKTEILAEEPEEEEKIEKEIPKSTQEVKGTEKEISEKEVIALIKRLDKGKGVKIEDFPEIEDKIYELIEKGELYEPIAGFVRVV